MIRIKRSPWLAGILTGALFCAPAMAPAATADERPLVLAFVPQENPEKLVGDIRVITGYLERELGVPVKGYVTVDHTAAIEALKNGDADVSFMGGLPYVLAHARIGARVVLAEVYRGSPTYRGRIFVRKDSGIEKLEDLRGRSIAFADPISESGYLYPRDIFAREGLIPRERDLKSFFGTVYFAGGYQQAIRAVANGYVDAAGVSQYADLLLKPEELEAVTWIAESELIPSHGVVVRKGLDEKRLTAFKRAMLELNQPERRHLLQHVYGPDGYVETSHEHYRSVEELARAYGLLTTKSP